MVLYQSADTLAAMFKLVQSGNSNVTLRSSGAIPSTEHDEQAPPGPCSKLSREEMETQDFSTLGCLQDLLNTDWEFEMFDWVRNISSSYLICVRFHLLIIL
jgi:hypothetical protein